MKTYVIVDTMNMAFRAKHVVHNADINTKVGMAFHIMFNSLRKVDFKFKPDHVIACFEGHSWRKAVDTKYKANRAAARAILTPREQEDDAIFIEAVDTFRSFLEHKTNVTVLQDKQLEADDLIAFWIQSHPDDRHIIISSDGDFVQLLAPNVSIYDGIKDQFIKLDGIYNDKDELILDKKTKKPLAAPDPEWSLFYKCIRGDTSDNIFSAFPGAREKSSKKSVGMREAYEDRHKQGFAWNNFMLTKWVDEDDNEHRVLDRYRHNELLIDLTKQPDNIKALGNQAIVKAVQREPVTGVGVNFLKFCSMWDLKKIATYPDDYARILNRRYVETVS